MKAPSGVTGDSKGGSAGYMSTGDKGSTRGKIAESSREMVTNTLVFKRVEV